MAHTALQFFSPHMALELQNELAPAFSMPQYTVHIPHCAICNHGPKHTLTCWHYAKKYGSVPYHWTRFPTSSYPSLSFLTIGLLEWIVAPIISCKYDLPPSPFFPRAQAPAGHEQFLPLPPIFLEHHLTFGPHVEVKPTTTQILSQAVKNGFPRRAICSPLCKGLR
jgi:hypothetical protein